MYLPPGCYVTRSSFPRPSLQKALLPCSMRWRWSVELNRSDWPQLRSETGGEAVSATIAKPFYTDWGLFNAIKQKPLSHATIQQKSADQHQTRRKRRDETRQEDQHSFGDPKGGWQWSGRKLCKCLFWQIRVTAKVKAPSADWWTNCWKWIIK